MTVAKDGGASQVMRTINLKQCIAHIAVISTVLLTQSMYGTEVLAAGKTYAGKEELAHCNLWDTIRRQWPATSLGLEPRECRRKAVAPTTSMTITCRLDREYIDEETGERMCIYQRGGYNQGPHTIAMDKYYQCPRTQQCKQSPGSGGSPSKGVR